LLFPDKFKSPLTAKRAKKNRELAEKLKFWRESNVEEKSCGQKNAGLKAVTLIATLNPVSQVLW
jgi:hypothetical protein